MWVSGNVDGAVIGGGDGDTGISWSSRSGSPVIVSVEGTNGTGS